MKNGWYEEYGNLFHYINNKWHNEKNLTNIHNNGNKCWFQNDKLHRLNGPSIEYYTGQKRWYYQGKRIKCQSQQELERYLKLKFLW